MFICKMATLQVNNFSWSIDDHHYLHLQVIAIDGGSGLDQLTTRVPVNISIADVNNKLPRLVHVNLFETKSSKYYY